MTDAAALPAPSSKLSWLRRPPQGSERYLLPLAVIAWDLIFSFLLAFFFELKGWLPELPWDPVPILTPYLPYDLIVPASGEEVLFRIIPLILAMRFWKLRWPTWAVLVASSVLFGYIHGGWIHIFLQGVGGFLYSLLFIKFSDDGKSFLRASTVVIIAHVAFNALVVLSLLSTGETTW